MNKLIAKIVFIVISLSAAHAQATTIGGSDMGWSLDFDQVSTSQKKNFGWFDDKLKTTGFQEFSNTYTAPGTRWSLTGKVVATHIVSGPALFSIIELLRDSTTEDVKKLHYRAMSDAKGFKEVGCIRTEQGAQSCEVLVDNWSPAKAFFANFYEWKSGTRTFVLVVRNAQQSPDKEVVNQAMQALIPLIKN